MGLRLLSPAFLSILLLASVALACISNFDRTELLDERALSLEVGVGKSLFSLNLNGFLVVSGDIPRRVRLYFLTALDFLAYNRSGLLPNVFMDEEHSQVSVQNLAYILVENGSGKRLTINLTLSVYSRDKPYAWLAIPAYLLIVMFVALLFLELTKMREGRTLSSASPPTRIPQYL